MRGISVAVAAAFTAAAHRRAPAPIDILIGAATARLEVAGGALAQQLARPMRRAPDGDAALVIRAWDERETGVAWPLDRGEAALGFEFYYAQGWLDAGPPPVLYAAYHGAATNPGWERAAPLRPMLDTWARGRGDLFVHAGAVASDGAAALLIGPSGAGKSTTALAAAGAGLDFLADDYCLLAADDTVHGLYSSAKRHDGAMPVFPWLAQADNDPPDGHEAKRVFYLDGNPAVRLGQPAPLKAIVILGRDGAPTGLRRAEAGAALRALIPSNLFQAPVIERAAITRLGQACRQTPCWYLAPSSDPMETAQMVRRALVS